MLAAWIGARWVSPPIRPLAAAARDIGLDIHRPPMAEQGTEECRAATRVFNQMQAQICRQLDERDRFVAAVSHDLRTPLTRLALRAEGLEDPVARRAFGRDIVEMNDMITATLDYLRGAADPEPFVLLDVASLLGSLADDRQACGQDVGLTMGPIRPFRAQTSSLRRCIDNLVENALRYGGSAPPDRPCRPPLHRGARRRPRHSGSGTRTGARTLPSARGLAQPPPRRRRPGPGDRA